MTEWQAKIRDRRERLGWSQRELATRAGVTVQTISNLERGRHGPSPETVAAIERALEDGKMTPEEAPR